MFVCPVAAVKDNRRDLFFDAGIDHRYTVCNCLSFLLGDKTGHVERVPMLRRMECRRFHLTNVE